MKRLSNIFVWMAAVGGSVLLVSCLKNSSQTFDFSTVGSSVDQLTSINYLNTNANGGQTLANQNCYFMIPRWDSTYTALDSVQLEMGGSTVGKDVTVTIGLDTAGFNAFNTSNGGGYTLLPSNFYTIDTPTGVIPAGQHFGEIYFHFNLKGFDTTKQYILPLKITDAQGTLISANFGSIMYEIVPGNQYMGLYHSVGQRTSSTNVYTINDQKYVYDLSGVERVLAMNGSVFPTSGGHSITPPSNYVPNVTVTNAADQVIYLAIGQQMDLTVNSGNSVTVSNDYLYGFGIFTYTFVSGTSSYNPSTHTFTLSYGFTDPYSGDTSVVSEVMTRER
jgi:hypothetical protein